MASAKLPPNDPNDPMKISGASVDSYRQALEHLGIWQDFKPKLAPETVALLEHPPLAVTFIDSKHIEPVVQALEQHYGAAMCEKFGRAVIEGGLMGILKPMIRATLGLLGSDPKSLLSRMNLFTSTSVKGVTTTYTSTGDRSGTLVVTFARPTLRANLLVWKGTMDVLFELCSAKGQVSEPVQSEDLTSASFSLTWVPSAKATLPPAAR